MQDLETGVDLVREVYEKNHYKPRLLDKRTVFFICIIISLCTIFYCLIMEYKQNIQNLNLKLQEKYVITTDKENEFYKQYINDELIYTEINYYSELYKIDKSLILAIIITESNLNTKAYNINSNGSADRGLMQLNSKTFEDLNKKDFYDVSTNIEHGTTYLQWCISNSESNILKAVAMYNVGKQGLRYKINDAFNYANKVINLQKIIEEKCLVFILTDGTIGFLNK